MTDIAIEKTAALLEGAATSMKEDAFAALVARQSRFVFRVAYSVVRNAADAEEVTQDTFLRVFRSSGWHSVVDERAFLARTAWRLALGKLRKNSRTRPMTEATACTNSDPESEAIRSDISGIVTALVDKLPDDLRLPLSLSMTEEFTSRDIAALMGIPEGTVRTRIQRARQLVRSKLEAVLEKKAGEQHG